MRHALFLLLAVALATGCARKEKKGSGATFIWGRSGDAVKLDPALVTDGESVQVITNLFDTLVTFKPGSTELMPWLATSWTTSDDGLVWTFALREGVQFHDGTAVNAKAVVFTFERQKDKDHPARKKDDVFAYYTTNFRALKSIEAVDEHTVRFTLSQPYAPFLSALALFSCSIVSPAAFDREVDFSMHPVGSGAFVFESWQRDSQIVLTANTKHWDAPKIGRLIFKPIENPQARLKELESGGIHGMDNPDLLDIASAEKDSALSVVRKPGINVCYLALNNQKKPFDDKRVRQAIAFAIDKKRLIRAAYDGKADPAVTMCPRSMAGYHDITDRKPSIDRAKQLLADAGFPDGFSTVLWYPAIQRTYLPDSGGTAIQIQQDLKAIGIDAKLKKVEWAAYLSATSNGDHPMCILGWMADIFDPDNFLYVLLDKDNAVAPAENRSFYRGERVHQLLLQAQRSAEWSKRQALYAEIQTALHEDVPCVPLATAPDFRILSSRVAGYELYPAGGEYFRHVSFKK